MKKDYGSSAKQLVQAMGGKDNITRVFHCMTRLRFYVKDRSKIDEAAIKKLSEISEKMDKKHQREPSCNEGSL